MDAQTLNQKEHIGVVVQVPVSREGFGVIVWEVVRFTLSVIVLSHC